MSHSRSCCSSCASETSPAKMTRSRNVCAGMARAKRSAQRRSIRQRAVFADKNKSRERIFRAKLGDRREQDIGSLSAFESTRIQNRDEVLVLRVEAISRVRSDCVAFDLPFHEAESRRVRRRTSNRKIASIVSMTALLFARTPSARVATNFSASRNLFVGLPFCGSHVRLASPDSSRSLSSIGVCRLVTTQNSPDRIAARPSTSQIGASTMSIGCISLSRFSSRSIRAECRQMCGGTFTPFGVEAFVAVFDQSMYPDSVFEIDGVRDASRCRSRQNVNVVSAFRQPLRQIVRQPSDSADHTWRILLAQERDRQLFRLRQENRTRLEFAGPSGSRLAVRKIHVVRNFSAQFCGDRRAQQSPRTIHAQVEALLRPRRPCPRANARAHRLESFPAKYSSSRCRARRDTKFPSPSIVPPTARRPATRSSAKNKCDFESSARNSCSRAFRCECDSAGSGDTRTPAEFASACTRRRSSAR